MPSPTVLALATFGAGLLATLVLAAYLTPRAWWRRPNARALAVLASGTLVIGGVLAWLVTPREHVRSALLASASAPLPGQAYQVYRDLNLRAGSGVDAPRLAVVPAGGQVIATGVRQGDWWQLSTTVDGHTRLGWASSLWLRRPGELQPFTKGN
jgi:hypothetical protein